MKKLLVLLLLVTVSTAIAQQKKPVPAPKKQVVQQKDKYHDNVDDRMKGPKGEKVYIGPNGGRYYLKNGKKVYVDYKGNKKKV